MNSSARRPEPSLRRSSLRHLVSFDVARSLRSSRRPPNRDADAGGYFITKLSFEHDVAPIFGPLLFQPAVVVVQALAQRLRALQSGQLNLYLSLIGLLLVLVLGLTLF